MVVLTPAIISADTGSYNDEQKLTFRYRRFRSKTLNPILEVVLTEIRCSDMFHCPFVK